MKTASELRAFARKKLSGHWVSAIVATLLASLLGGTGMGSVSSGATLSNEESQQLLTEVESMLQSGSHALENNWEVLLPVGIFVLGVLIVALLIGLVLYVVGAAVNLGHKSFYLTLTQDGQPQVGQLFSRFSILLRTLGQKILIGLFSELPVIVLIPLLLPVLLFQNTLTFLLVALYITVAIPLGCYVSWGFVLAPYILAEAPHTRVMESLRLSWKLMRGERIRWFCLGLSFIGWAILAAFTCGIGALWLNPYIEATQAAFYLDVRGRLILNQTL